MSSHQIGRCIDEDALQILREIISSGGNFTFTPRADSEQRCCDIDWLDINYVLRHCKELRPDTGDYQGCYLARGLTGDGNSVTLLVSLNKKQNRIKIVSVWRNN